MAHNMRRFVLWALIALSLSSGTVTAARWRHGTGSAPGRALIVTATPPSASLLTTDPLGTTVTTLTAHWTDNSPFTGDYLIDSASDPTVIYSLTLNADRSATLKIRAAGPGVASQGGTTQNLSVEAYQ